MALTTIPEVTGVDPGAIMSPAGIVVWLFSVAGLLPTIIGAFAALAAGVYYSVKFWESETVRTMRRGWNTRKAAKRIAKLQYAQARIIGELKQLGALVTAETHMQKGVETTHIESKPADAAIPAKN